MIREDINHLQQLGQRAQESATRFLNDLRVQHRARWETSRESLHERVEHHGRKAGSSMFFAGMSLVGATGLMVAGAGQGVTPVQLAAGTAASIGGVAAGKAIYHAVAEQISIALAASRSRGSMAETYVPPADAVLLLSHGRTLWDRAIALLTNPPQAKALGAAPQAIPTGGAPLRPDIQALKETAMQATETTDTFLKQLRTADVHSFTQGRKEAVTKESDHAKAVLQYGVLSASSLAGAAGYVAAFGVGSACPPLLLGIAVVAYFKADAHADARWRANAVANDSYIRPTDSQLLAQEDKVASISRWDRAIQFAKERLGLDAVAPHEGEVASTITVHGSRSVDAAAAQSAIDSRVTRAKRAAPGR